MLLFQPDFIPVFIAHKYINYSSLTYGYILLLLKFITHTCFRFYMDKEEIKFLIFGISITLLILGAAIVIFFFYFQKKKTKFLLDRAAAKKQFEDELAKSEIEIREQTLENISWEIHDNVGQLLSVAKMQLNILHPSLNKEQQVELDESGKLISKSLQELRGLAKALNPKYIKNLGFLSAVKLELERFNRMKFIKAELEVKGKPYSLPSDKGIILFRILQEFFNNTMKHAKSPKLCVMIDYKPNNLYIKVYDKGVGFDLDCLNNAKGLGLQTIKSRAKLIKADLKLESKKNHGTSISINYPIKTD